MLLVEDRTLIQNWTVPFFLYHSKLLINHTSQIVAKGQGQVLLYVDIVIYVYDDFIYYCHTNIQPPMLLFIQAVVSLHLSN